MMSKMMKIVTILGVVIVSIVLLFAGCAPKEEAAGEAQDDGATASLLNDIVRRGTLKVGMSTFVPWAMKDKNGDLIGFEIDVATRLAEEMGVDVEFIPTEWSGIIPALLTGKFDVIIGGMGIRPERNLKVNFTIPYDYSGMSIVANKKLAPGYASLEEFNKPDVTIAVRIGTTAESAAKKYMPEAQLKPFDNESKAIQELLSDRAHAVIASAPLPAYQTINYPDSLYLPLEGTFTKEPIGFAIRKGDVDLLNYFNNWITVVESEGWLAERHHYWFGTRDWEDQIQ